MIGFFLRIYLPQISKFVPLKHLNIYHQRKTQVAALLKLQGEARVGGQPSIKRDVEYLPRINRVLP